MLIKRLLQNENKHSGQLSHDDIIRELESGNLIIKPLRKENGDYQDIKSASFDISPSCLIMSVKQGRFVRIYSSMSRCKNGHRIPEWHCKACQNTAIKRGLSLKSCTEQRYVYIKPRDTVLVLSKEYLQLPEYICGNVFSRVTTVSAGLGHISTTIDSLWKGALLIAISNPSSKPIKLLLQDSEASCIPLATVTLQYLNMPVKRNTVHTTYLPARVDILEKYLYNVDESKSRMLLLKNVISRFIHMKDYNLTVSLIGRLKEMKDIEPDEWEDKLKELEQEVCAQKIREKKWWNFLMGMIRWIQKLLPIAVIIAFAYALYPALTNKQSFDVSDFTVPMFIAVVECILRLFTSIND